MEYLLHLHAWPVRYRRWVKSAADSTNPTFPCTDDKLTWSDHITIFEHTLSRSEKIFKTSSRPKSGTTLIPSCINFPIYI